MRKIKLEQFTLYVIVMGFTVFYGYASFSNKWQEYSMWDVGYNVWDKLCMLLLVTCIYKSQNQLKKYWKLLLPLLIVRECWQVIFELFKISNNSWVFKVENIICFVWMLIIIDSIGKVRKNILNRK